MKAQYEIRKTKGAFAYPKDKDFTVVVSRHTTLEAAKKAEARFDRATTKRCGSGSWDTTCKIFEITA